MNRKIEHLIVDAAGFLKNVQLQELAENIYTIQEVVSEIRDSATRRRLAVLPYDIKFKTPSSDSVVHVSDFAKKTGDWGSLSATDVKVMALTYQLTAEISGSEHLKQVPEKKMTITCSKKPLQKATDIAGFYFPEKNTESEVKNCGDSSIDSISHVEDLSSDVKDSSSEVKDSSSDAKDSISDVNDISIEDEVSERVQEVDNEKQLSKNNDINMEESDDQKSAELVDSEHSETIFDAEDNLNDDAEDDDDIGWITPSNINQVKNYIDSDLTEANTVKVGCLTTDFAMQNVLIQIGLSVVSVDGMLIKKAKSYALRCYSCFKITSNTSKVFCPKCGNKTLTKVTVTVDEDGTQRYHLSSRRAINKRGLKYPLPLPKGGKHAVNPVLVEDQPVPQNRPAKKTLAKINAFDPDYVARGSPFAINDVTSRAAQLGVRSSGGNSSRRRNPNESGRRKGRKKPLGVRVGLAAVASCCIY